MTIYTWGYGHEVWEMLQGVKAFVANDAYMSAIAIAIMLFMLMIRFLNTGQVDWKMFLVSLIAVSVFLKPSTTTFNIVDEETIESIKRLTKGNFRDTRNLLRKSQILSDLNDGIPINKELIEHAVQMMLLHNANY